MAFAEHEFDLGRADKNGTTMRQHLMQVKKQIKHAPEGLIGPKLPRDMAYLWEMFLSLNAGRGGGEGGPDPLSYVEIKAWCDLCEADLTVWELDILKRLDAAFLSVDRRPANF